MVICPKCGAQNGKRNPNPVKCCRCWYQFVRSGNANVKDSRSTPRGATVRGPGNKTPAPVRPRKQAVRLGRQRNFAALQYGPDPGAGGNAETVEAGVAQLVEQRSSSPQVLGSSPNPRSNFSDDSGIVHDPEFCQDRNCRECRRLRAAN